MGVSILIFAVLLGATGAGAVAFEIAAVRAFTSTIGSTVEAAAVVVAVFLGTLALGAWLFGRLADRGARPVVLFGVLALCGGAAVLAVPALHSLAGDAVLARAFGERGWMRAFWLTCGALAVVGLPPLLLGGTLPALIAALGDRRSCRRFGGILYGCNTLGSVAGALLAGLVLLEAVGIRRTMMFSGLLICAAGVCGVVFGRRCEQRALVARPAGGGRTAWRLSGVAFAAGFTTLALEFLATRLLMQYLQNSAWSFTLVLAVFLLGIGMGAALGARLADRLEQVEPAAAVLLALIAVFTAAAGPAVVWIGEAAGLDMVRSLSAQAGLALVVLPASVASGALFALLLGQPHSAATAGLHVGRLTLANTVGGVLGTSLAGFVLVPAIGLRYAVLTAALVAVAGAVAVARTRISLAATGAGLGLVLALTLPFDLRILPNDPNFPVLLSYHEGPVANVIVLEARGGERPVLHINRTARQGGGAAWTVEHRQGLIAAALHARARSALVLGVGTGATVQGLIDAGVVAVDAVELVDSVIDALPYFGRGGSNLLLRNDVEFYREDAVAFARWSRKKYDVVLGDLYFPWMDGTGALYSVEHFEAVRERLAPGGLFCQWVPLHQLRWEDFGLLARTFTRAFPQTWMFLAEPRAAHPVVALVGSKDLLRLVPERYDELFTASLSSRAYQRVELREAGDLLELYLGDQYTIDAAFGGARAFGEERLVNTIDRPVLEYRAARTTETEQVLAVTNFNNIALELGGSIISYLDFAAGTAANERERYETRLNRRASALVQYLTGHYWRLRAMISPEDPLGMEQHEARQYLTGLTLVPRHRLLNEAVEELTLRGIQGHRYSDVVAFASQVLQLNPENFAVARGLGLAQLLLGDADAAVLALTHARGLEEDDSLNLTLLGIAQYLGHKDEPARATLDAALRSSAAGTSRIAAAIVLALDGAPAEAARAVEPLVDHPLWGVLATRALTRFRSQEVEQEPERNP